MCNKMGIIISARAVDGDNRDNRGATVDGDNNNKVVTMDGEIKVEIKAPGEDNKEEIVDGGVKEAIKVDGEDNNNKEAGEDSKVVIKADGEAKVVIKVDGEDKVTTDGDLYLYCKSLTKIIFLHIIILIFIINKFFSKIFF